MNSARQTRIVIVGAGIAGVSAAESARKQSPHAEIILLSKESCIPYYRLNLTRYMAGEITAENLSLHPEEWYRDNGIKLMRGIEVESIDIEHKTVSLDNGGVKRYDKLIIATGSHAFIPSIPGVDLENVHTIRTCDDADKVLAACRKSSRCVCVGGGLLGLEIAGALKIHGVNVTVLEGFDWLLPHQLNREAATILEKYIASRGITVRTAAAPIKLTGNKEVREVVLANEESVPADLVVFATGVRSNSDLARTAGITVDRGIVVENSMMTSHPDVFAAGEAAEHLGIIHGTWAPCQHQGNIAGTNAAGTYAEFTEVPSKYTLKVLGYKMFSVGTISAPDGSYMVIKTETDGNFYSFLFHDNLMEGAILMGDTSLSSTIKAIVERKLDCSDMLLNKPSAAKIIESLNNWKFS